ncbi:hypothetical protein AABB24_012699, partial [Solanum stoloniferum]
NLSTPQDQRSSPLFHKSRLKFSPPSLDVCSSFSQKNFLPQNVFLLPQEPFTPLSHQSLPKNGYEQLENGNFRWFLARSIRPPSIIASSYQLYVPSIIFYEPKQTSKALPPALLRPKMVKGVKNHWIWANCPFNLMGARFHQLFFERSRGSKSAIKKKKILAL